MGCKYFAFPYHTDIKGIAKFKPNFHLKYLFLSVSQSSEILLDLAASCHGIEKLTLLNIKNISERGIANILKCIVQNSGTLKVLVINFCKMKDDIWELISKLCVEIQELNIRGVGISQKSLDYFCSNVTTKIKKLDISWQPNFGDDQLKTLVTRCELTELCLTQTSVTNDSVNSIVQKLPRLSKFEFENNTFSLSNVLQIASLPSLKTLCIWNMPRKEKEEILKIVPNLCFSKKDENCNKPSDKKCLFCESLCIAMPYQSCTGSNNFGFWEIKNELRYFQN